MRKKCVQIFGRKTLKERDHIEATGIDVRVILICVLNRVGRRSMY